VTDVKLSPETAKRMEFDKSKNKSLDFEVISKSIPQWMNRFNKEIAPITGK
jgi:putative spermidine/putrescine transport system substrate-binding protein